MLLQYSTWPEVEDYLRRSNGIIVPIGSTEQHGPNGLIGTDAICPEIIARGLAQADDVMVAPTLAVGMAQHHMAFSGTITLRPSTLIAVVLDVVNSLARHGFDRIYFLNGHGGNIATVTAAFSEVYAEASLGTAGHNRVPLKLGLRNWWEGPKVKAISARRFGSSEGGHATPSEVSLTYFADRQAAERLRDVDMKPKVAPFGPIRDAEDYRRRFPDGRIGSDPSLASPEIGEELYKAALADVAEDYRKFIDKR